MDINKAAFEGNLTKLQSLVENGISVDYTDSSGWTPLILSASYGHEDIVSYLIENNANINATNKEAGTALMFAAMNGHYKIVEILISNGASIDLKNHLGETALWGASLHEHYDICKLLLHNGANLWVTNKKGWVVTGNYFNASGTVHLGLNAEIRNKMFEEAYEVGQILLKK